MADIQTEKAYQKQSGLNNYNKYLLYGEELPKRKTVSKKRKKIKKKNKKNQIRKIKKKEIIKNIIMMKMKNIMKVKYQFQRIKH